MSNIDKNNRLDENPFSYRSSKNNTIFIDYYGKQVKIVKGKEADKLLNKLASAGTDKEEQLILAKITGNFKRGNEKS
ncbi:hypothetical protein [Pseudalkalibacillus berkeleyi]|uniref:Uncharacterized protein n=1 Tax=Pseudalkalibacillus berkeleyi TaxID=1069813 RepID=A0ABS9GYC7_9BACL|nr:hypothetical protein [Pseudalkalibacillus berkeleyi]MCF6136610.1 hypothetical protein [Pseudalkalibacillus berkeleyi]